MARHADDGGRGDPLQHPKCWMVFATQSDDFSTRIKDAGIAIRHSQERILFYTAGSRNGLEGVGCRGYTYNIIKKNSKSSKKGSQLS